MPFFWARPDPNNRLLRLFKSGEVLEVAPLDLLGSTSARDALLEQGETDLKGAGRRHADLQLQHGFQGSDRRGHRTRQVQRAGPRGMRRRPAPVAAPASPCSSQLIAAYKGRLRAAPAKNKIEVLKEEKDGLDALPDVLRLAPTNNWQEMSEKDKQRASGTACSTARRRPDTS